MPDLNLPTGYHELRPGTGRWTRLEGLWNAMLYGTLVAMVLMIITGMLSYHFPIVMFQLSMRIALGVLITAIMFASVHGAAGMVSFICTVLATGLSMIVLYSNHVVMAAWSAPNVYRDLCGPDWLSIPMLLLLSGPALISVVLTTAACRHGGSPIAWVLDLLVMMMYVGKRR